MSSTSSEDGKNTLASMIRAGANVSGIVSNLVAYGYIESHVRCNAMFVVDQSVSLACKSPLGLQGRPFVTNKGCQLCQSVVQSVLDARASLDKDVEANNSRYTPTMASQETTKRLTGTTNNYEDGVCRYQCMQCVAEGLSQDLRFFLQNSCDYGNQDFKTAFVNSVADQAQSLMSGTVYDSGSPDFTVNIAQAIADITTVDVLTTITQQVFVVQSVRIRDNSSSVILQNVNQSVSLSMVTQFASDIMTEENIKNSIDFDIREKSTVVDAQLALILKNISDETKTMGIMIENTIGYFIVSGISILFILVLSVVVLLNFEIVQLTKPQKTFRIPVRRN